MIHDSLTHTSLQLTCAPLTIEVGRIAEGCREKAQQKPQARNAGLIVGFNGLFRKVLPHVHQCG
jgi:hypothetical protein